MLKTILLLAFAALAAFAIYVALRPADFRITRRLGIAAPPAVIFAHVNDLHRWVAWSPWENLDPGLQREYGGPAAGVGARYAWNGNNKVGQGSMTITESQPPERLALGLEFLRPFAAKNQTEFTFQPDSSGTVVTWTMTGRNNFMAKAAGVFMNMDQLVGSDFERGLANLKRVSEAPASP